MESLRSAKFIVVVLRQAHPQESMASFCSPPSSHGIHNASSRTPIHTVLPHTSSSQQVKLRGNPHGRLFRTERRAAGSLIEPVVAQEVKELEILDSIARLYIEKKAMEERVERNEEEGSKAGRETSDYSKRAYLYGCSAEMVITGKEKEERLSQELELLQDAVMEGDTGKSSADYRRRAQIFSTCAEIFTKHPF